MNKVITINLNGIAYQLEESGYEALHEYLDLAARQLEGNPDKDEIIADIEQAIGDKFRALLGAHKTVVITREVTDVITQMGPVQDATGAAADAAAGPTGVKPAGAAGPARPPTRRLYKISDGAMLAGVCSGLSAYFNIDVSFVRVGFALLSIFWGTGLLVYVILAFILPEANTPAEKAAASGAAATAEEFIRRAKAGYYEGLRHFNDKQAHREWKRKFKQEMRGWKHGFRQKMRENAHHWQQNWSQPWGPPPPFAPLVWPFLSVIRFVAFLVLLFAMLSLLADGAVWGVALPSGIPPWVGVVFLIVAYHLLTWPIKAMRRAWYYPGLGCYGYRPRMTGLWDSFVWLGFVVVLLWLADHYSPQFHEALKNTPPAVHHAMDEVRAWWIRQ